MELLPLLNQAFGVENSELFLYLREASIFKGKVIGGVDLGMLFEKFSQMELRHADRLAMKIIALGGKVVLHFPSLETAGSAAEILKKHLDHEKDAYEFYSQVIELADDPDFELIVRGIRDDEKEHADTIARLLENLANDNRKG
jgi:rubrerythrin